LPDASLDGIINTMIVTIDAAGRLVIPKAIREEAGLLPGEPLDVTVQDGRVEIVPAPRRIRMRERNGFRVAEAADSYEPLREDTVRSTRDRLRGRRKPR
jgi:AbrB family looped-hinge helix DNA binding protein